MMAMDYKAVFVPALGASESFEKEYETHAEAEIALSAIANYTLMLHSSGLMADHSNVGMVMKRDDDGEWVEIDGDGNEL